MLTVDALAQEIRRVDGNHSLGAGALAEALMPFISAALSIEQTQPVKVKALEWVEKLKDDGSRWRWIAGDYGVTQMDWNGFSSFDISRGHWLVGGPFDTLEAAKAAAQQDYETRIRSAIVEVPTAIPTNLVERCAEILEWKKTGLLPGTALRALGKKINDDFGGSHFIDNGLGQAELRTIDEAFHLILAISTRTADRADQDGSATLSKGLDDA